MNWVDYVILAIIGISVLISLLRGFTREALSLAAWVVAIWLTLTFTHYLQELFVPYVQTKGIRIALAVVFLLLFTLLMAALVNYMVMALLEKSGLSGTDRVVGTLFGFLRGVAIVVVLVLLAGLTELPQDRDWHESGLVHYFQNAALWLRQFIPPDVAASIKF